MPFSVRSPMAEKPYALGERPGDSRLPTQPLLSGKEAWASLSGYYDKKHGDSKLMDYDESPVIRASDRPEEKKAMDKEALKHLQKAYKATQGKSLGELSRSGWQQARKVAPKVGPALRSGGRKLRGSKELKTGICC